ncbi:MAG: TIGR00725 family protein [Caldiserica bacterium]|jgi:uncharacterized protein (TIGR00725 family)|nr:TIGR00725 family protein [Caldisericota bacterium]MDH7562274.1 TIGR00725 family protein [Caldisericota bacterium]
MKFENLRFRGIVGVIGERDASRENYLLAFSLGKALAKKGLLVISGGLGGVMEAVSRGAKEEGGFTVGILPGDDPHEANPWVDLPIVTGMGEARNLIIVKTSEVLVSVGGEFGTLSEMAFALKMGKPVISLNSWVPERGRVRSRTLFPVSTVEEAVSLVCQFLGLED